MNTQEIGCFRSSIAMFVLRAVSDIRKEEEGRKSL
jgi:hypothetical protein